MSVLNFSEWLFVSRNISPNQFNDLNRNEIAMLVKEYSKYKSFNKDVEENPFIKLVKLTKELVNLKTEEDILYCAIEEMSELTKVLTKRLRKSDKFAWGKLKEELSHVLMMLQILQHIYLVPLKEIEKEQIQTLEKAISEETSKKGK